MTNRCLIISGAPNCFFPSNFKQSDFVIACDGGYIHAMKAGIVPDLLVSDFDSFNGADKSFHGDSPGGTGKR